MAYNNKETLKDVKGNPIPQYYDPKDDTYKPLDGPITVQDAFADTANVTKTYSSSMSGFAVQNDGTTNLTFTINGLTITVKPTEGFEDIFEPFTSVQVNATGAFRAVVKG
jgi:hypothetical protein